MRWPAVTAIAVLAFASTMATPAAAHVDRPHEPTKDEPAEAPAEPADGHEESVGGGDGAAEPAAPETADETPELTLRAAESVPLGASFVLEAELRSPGGEPVAGAPIVFSREAGWGGWLSADSEVGQALTDDDGIARVTTAARSSGDQRFVARFDGPGGTEATDASTSLEVVGDRQLYAPDVGLRVPGVGVWWLIVAIAAVWGIYTLVLSQVVGIARAGAPREAAVEGSGARRQFLARYLFPAGAVAAVSGLGMGLVGLLARSPRTHGNLGSSGTDPWGGGGVRHRTTPVARVGQGSTLRELPPLLDREVSFSQEVLPILRAKAGPHAHQPEHSPPPNRIRLDSYEGIMANSASAGDAQGEGHGDGHGGGHALVVPGEPMESRIVTVLLDPSMQMPPAVPALLDEEIQIIASWVAQGARKT